MEITSFRINSELLARARSKAGRLGLSKHLRILITKWLTGEIEITRQDFINDNKKSLHK